MSNSRAKLSGNRL